MSERNNPKRVTVFRLGKLCILFCAAFLTGCAHGKAYVLDRGRDAADIFTLTAGIGGGAKARVGPVQIGLLSAVDVAGLRGGRLYAWGLWDKDEQDFPGPRDVDFFIFPLWFFGWDSFGHLEFSDERNKHYTVLKDLPFISIPDYEGRQSWHYFTQIEAVVGLGPMVRIGFNPGELLDFVLGFFLIDIFDDDIEVKMVRSERQKESGASPQNSRLEPNDESSD